jgi:glutamyl-tRNA reductase
VPGVKLLDLQDLRAYADAEMQARRAEVDSVRAIVEEELERYRTSVFGRSVAPVVASLRQRAEQLRAAELERIRPRLDQLEPTDRDAVEAFSRRLVAKLLHDPTVQVKNAAGSARGERLAEALRQLFDLSAQES